MDFLRRNRVLISAFSLLLLSILLLSVGVRSRPYRDPFAGVVLEIFTPLEGAVDWVQRGVSGVWYGYINLVGVRAENEVLESEVARLRARTVRLAELERSHERMAELLQFRSQLEGRVLGARVVGRDPLPWFRSFVIDLGRGDGIRAGLAVLAPGGVVGRVTEVSRGAARVMLLTDNDSGIDAVVQRSRARGIVQGSRDRGCQMNYLRRDVDVVPGDLVVTSGLDGIFPKGVLIGTVAELSLENRGLLRSARVEPSVQLDELEEVLVVDASGGLGPGESFAPSSAPGDVLD